MFYRVRWQDMIFFLFSCCYRWHFTSTVSFHNVLTYWICSRLAALEGLLLMICDMKEFSTAGIISSLLLRTEINYRKFENNHLVQNNYLSNCPMLLSRESSLANTPFYFYQHFKYRFYLTKQLIKVTVIQHHNSPSFRMRFSRINYK